jgi:RHS repeat-associated protein
VGSGGTVRLTATAPGAAASGWIQVQPLGTPYISYPIRNLCLTVALPGAASECGDLRLAHPLPSVRTRNRTRTPVLLYNSALAQPRFRYVYNLTASASKPAVDSIAQSVTLADGRNLGWQTWGGPWAPGEVRRMVYSAPAAHLPTGLYPVTIETRAWRSGVATTVSQQAEIAVVNRSESRIGAGWWLAGLEQLLPLSAGRKLWVGGDGSTGVYVPLTDSTWVAWNTERPDTLKKRVNAQSTTRFVRLLPGGARVVFGASGTHDSTVTRTGDVTAFAYGPHGLASITVPGGAAYTFQYFTVDGRTRVWYIWLNSGTEQRMVMFGPHNGDPRVFAIQDADGGLTTFQYAAPDTTHKRITGRMDRRRLTWATYAYDAIGKVTRGQLDMGAAGEADDLAVHVAPGESRGAAPLAVPFDSAYTRVDGPRSDVADVTRFWYAPTLDNSVPRRVVDALGNETVLTYGDARFEALATRVDHPVLANGTRQSTHATYDARGNLQSSTLVDPLGDGRDATTWYERTSTAWPDFVTRVTHPTGEVSEVGYDAAGNRIWQQDGRGAPSRVTFGYNTLGLPTSVTDPNGHAETIVYDGAGNLHATRTALGFWTLAYADALGRDTLVIAPSDSASATDSTVLRTTGVRTRTVYDAANRPLLTRTVGPRTHYYRTYEGMPVMVDSLAVTVRNVYDNGMLVRTDRWATPDSAKIDTISTRWRYDAAGRRVAEIAPASPDSAERKDSTAYDPAGNVVRTVDRMGREIVMQHDALGRLLQRTIPATPEVPGETETFTYDAMGRMRSALNAAARVRRGYLRGGALAADTLEIATEAGAWGRHRFVTQYGYDLSGRRVSMTVPDSLAPSSTQKQFQYAYHPQTGALRSVTDPLGNAFTFAHRLDGALDTLGLPGGIRERYGYDDDGRMTLRMRELVSGMFASSLYEDTLVYTARGKVSYAGRMEGRTALDYDGMGHLVHSFSHDPEVHALQDSEEEYRLDGMGNALWNRTAGFDAASPPGDPVYPVNQFYQRWTGRHFATVKAAYETLVGYLRPRQDAQRTFDAAGNLLQSVNHEQVRLAFGATVAGGEGNRPRIKTLYAYTDESIALNAASSVTDGVQQTTTDYLYRGDGRLVQVNRVAGCVFLEMQNLCSSQAAHYHAQTRTEHYRYDALGRRVWVKTLTSQDTTIHGTCRFRCDNTTRRTVWDGDQVLAEIRYPNGQGEQDSGLDSANVAAANEKLARPTTQAGNPYGGPNTSDWAQHGRVLHVHAGGIDQPLGLIRMDYSFDFPEATLIVPHANWRGLYESGTVVGRPQCKIDIYLPYGEVVFMDSTGRRKVHPAVVTDQEGFELDTTQTRCIEIDFPGKAMGMRHLLRQNTVAGPISWMGSLVQDNQDASGLMYRRNRFYDPKSGRFTQEDPIGLAGGVNLYGFAEGDAVTYRDPFGLKIVCKTAEACALWNDLARRANEARLSRNPTIRMAGQLLASLMHDAYTDPEHTYYLYVADMSTTFEERTGGGDEEPAGDGGRDIRVDTNPQTRHVRIAPWIIFAHELGGAVGRRRGRYHADAAPEAENAARTLADCRHRHGHDNSEGIKGAIRNPICR